jgi:cytochrome c
MSRIMALILGLGAIGSMAAPALADPAEGQKVYTRNCVACHTINATAARRVGPTLFGIVGRKTGSDEGFPRYTPANKNANLTWDRATLDKYLADPKAVIPGTNMTFVGVRRAEERNDLIDYLETLK